MGNSRPPLRARICISSLAETVAPSGDGESPLHPCTMQYSRVFQSVRMKTCRFLLLVFFQIVLPTELDPAAIREQPFNNKLPLAKLPLERISRGHPRSGLLCFDGCGRPIVRVKITLPCYRGPRRPRSRHAETTDELFPQNINLPWG